MESPDATNLPVRFAISLLKNSKANRPASARVGVALHSQFSIGSVILSAFINLLTATSPFSLIAAAFGGSGAQYILLGYIEVALGYATLTPDSQKKLDDGRDGVGGFLQLPRSSTSRGALIQRQGWLPRSLTGAQHRAALEKKTRDRAQTRIRKPPRVHGGLQQVPGAVSL